MLLVELVGDNHHYFDFDYLNNFVERQDYFQKMRVHEDYE